VTVNVEAFVGHDRLPPGPAGRVRMANTDTIMR